MSEKNLYMVCGMISIKEYRDGRPSSIRGDFEATDIIDAIEQAKAKGYYDIDEARMLEPRYAACRGGCCSC